MIKIFMSVRNRLEITKKAIEALERHTDGKFSLYVYDNLTDHNIGKHFEYYHKKFEEGVIDQICFTTKRSTFNAFSKATSSNMFGAQHMMDPQKDNYEFILMMDNDIIVTPGWDTMLKKAWKDVEKFKMNYIKIVGQIPNGVVQRKDIMEKIAGLKTQVGTFGGSGFWSVRPNFYIDVGLLNLKQMVGMNKKHDQHYWKLLFDSAKTHGYALCIDHILFYHAKHAVGSVCNTLTTQRNPTKGMQQINNEDDKLASMSFEDFYKTISNEELRCSHT